MNKFLLLLFATSLFSCSSKDQGKVNPRESIADSLIVKRNLRFEESEKLHPVTIYTHAFAMQEIPGGLKDITEKNYPNLSLYSEKENKPARIQDCPFRFYFASASDLYAIEMIDLEENKPLYKINGIYFENENRQGILTREIMVYYDSRLFAEETGNADIELFIDREYGGRCISLKEDLFSLKFIYEPTGYFIYAWDDLQTKKWVKRIWTSKIDCPK